MKTTQIAFRNLRKFALSMPETGEEFPWGETAIKVRSKTFLFIWQGEEGLRLSVKLPHSREFALEYPFTEPTRYGLGKSGWVTAKFSRRATPPLDVLQAWTLESYRAVAPKALLKKLGA